MEQKMLEEILQTLLDLKEEVQSIKEQVEEKKSVEKMHKGNIQMLLKNNELEHAVYKKRIAEIEDKTYKNEIKIESLDKMIKY